MQPEPAARSGAATLATKGMDGKMSEIFAGWERLPAQTRSTELIEYEQNIALAGDFAHHRHVRKRLALLGGDPIILRPGLVREQPLDKVGTGARSLLAGIGCDRKFLHASYS